MSRFKLDENLPAEIAEAYRQAGHDTMTIFDQDMAGFRDKRIADICAQEGRAVMTLDLDFGDLRAFVPSQYAGIILLRPHRQSRDILIDLATRLLPMFETEPLAGRLWVVTDDAVRTRGDL